MKKSVTVLLASLLAVIVGCASYQPLTSMRGTDISAPDKASAPLKYLGSKPGSQKIIARTFAQQPPLIPHAVDNFDEMTLTENQCLDCHGAANFVKKNSPQMSDSHFVAADKSFSALRYTCTSCHVAQVDAPALVENRFPGNTK